jgi:hypothetical protein
MYPGAHREFLYSGAHREFLQQIGGSGEGALEKEFGSKRKNEIAH